MNRVTAPTSDDAAVAAVGLSFSYGSGLKLFEGLDVAFDPGSISCITGRSGVGKSTLLYCLSGVLAAEGVVRIQGVKLTNDATQRATIRRKNCGFIFQRGELLPELSIAENVALPLRLLGTRPNKASQKARALLDRFDIAECGDHFPDEISGGQAQRASVARALIHSPSVIFADEPTASLDRQNRSIVVQSLREVLSQGTAVICATHDPDLIENSDYRCDLEKLSGQQLV